MREYQRERNDLQSQVKDLNKRATYHDAHIRLIDAWFTQLLDEISVQIHGVPVVSKGMRSTSCAAKPETDHR